MLESIRIDQTLVGMPMYRILFDLPPIEEDETPQPAPEQSVDEQVMAQFISYIGPLEGPRRRAIEAVGTPSPAETSPRRRLLEHFQSHYMHSVSSGEVSDEDLTEAPSDRNAPPLAITVHAAPALSPPLYDIAAGAVPKRRDS